MRQRPYSDTQEIPWLTPELKYSLIQAAFILLLLSIQRLFRLAKEATH